jgi:hypothetical protein
MWLQMWKKHSRTDIYYTSTDGILEFNTDLHILFVDYKKAFDNINRTELLNVMGSYGIPKKLVRLVKMTMKDSNAKITIAGNVSKSFNVLQGDREMASQQFYSTCHSIKYRKS